MDGAAAGVADGEVTFPRGHREAGALDLHFDRPEAPVVRVVARRVPNEVVVAEIGFDAVEALAQVVRAVEGQAAGTLRQRAQAGMRILAEHVLVLLERLGERPLAAAPPGSAPAARPLRH